jgi:hypothetical protein
MRLTDSRVDGKPTPLPELPIQYADYAAWQRERLRGDALERLLAYWRSHLGDNPPLLELPTDHHVGGPSAHSPFLCAMLDFLAAMILVISMTCQQLDTTELCSSTYC